MARPAATPESGAPLPGRGSREFSLFGWSCDAPFPSPLPHPGGGSRSKQLELFCVHWHVFLKATHSQVYASLKGLLVEACSLWVEVHQILSHPEKRGLGA